MKPAIIFLLIGFLTYSASCGKSDPTISNREGMSLKEIFTLNSRHNKGFSFENLKVTGYPVKPDFIIIPQKNLTGDALSPFLSHPDLENSFFLISEFRDLQSAQECFESKNLRLPKNNTLQQFASELKANQVWIVRTANGDFGKILIVETRMNRSTPFAEIRFKAEMPG